MIIDELPFDIFLDNILPYLKQNHVISLAIVSKDMNELCDNNQVWREIYIRRKKRDFYKKENKLARNIALNCNGFTPDMNNPPASPQPINLFIKNESDTTFDVIYAHFTTIGSRNRVKRYGEVGPHELRIIPSYLNHRWLITPQENNKTNEVYKSKTFFTNRSDICPSLVSYVNKDGKIKYYENVIHVNIGKPYDKDSAQHVVNLPLPKNPRKFKQFKKMIFKSCLPKVKKGLALNKRLVPVYEGYIGDGKKRLEVHIKAKTLYLEEMKETLEKTKTEVQKMTDFVNVTSKM